MDPKDISIDDYTYQLPDDRIAKYPLQKRDEAKLLYYSDGVIRDARFTDFEHLLPLRAVLVMNTTKVIRARLEFFRTTGARIEIFCLEPYSPALYEQSLATKGEVVWHCLVGQAKKWKEPYLEKDLGDGKRLRVNKVSDDTSAANSRLIRFEWDNDMRFGELLEYLGELPIPPYLNRKTEESDLVDYQTVYARQEGSVAAPTAGLHFTEESLQRLHDAGYQQIPVTLHVGAGTFLPVKSKTMGGHTMHTEVIEVSLTSLKDIYQNVCDGIPIVSVGTTSTRTLESLYYMGVQVLTGVSEPYTVPQWLPYRLPQSLEKMPAVDEALHALIKDVEERGAAKLFGQTQLMIAPGYEYRLVEYLVTNFHQPNSTLLLLVAAFVGDDWHKIYEYALQNGYRFFSYGDGSLLKKR